jgi:predicted peroxiredoxin
MQPLRSYFTLALVLWLTFGAMTAQAVEPVKPALFVNLTSVDPHRVEMALNLSETAAKRGHVVTVFLNIDSVRIAENGNPVFEPSRTHLQNVMKAGAKVIVCPHCLGYAGLKEANLISGVMVGNPDLTFGALFAPDTRVMSW